MLQQDEAQMIKKCKFIYVGGLNFVFYKVLAF